MFNLLQLLSFFWLVRTFKAILFWIYLWQLKEYHVGRFVDHFRTEKGKRIFFNFLLLGKLFLFILFFINFSIAFYLLLLIYVAETVLLFIKKYKQPTWTFKTIFLASVSCLAAIAFLIHASALDSRSFTISLLLFDIFSSVIVSAIVLCFQPFFVLARNNILKKAKKKMETFNHLTVIGITGSYGKTSTKEFLATILSEKFNVLATLEHKNSEIGIAQTILHNLNDTHQIFIVEMGSYNRGGITLLCDIVEPTIGVVTGVNEQHLATFGSMENLLSAEGGRELASHLPKNGVMVLNGDNAYCLDLYKKIINDKTPRTKIYALGRNTISSDAWTEDIEVTKDSLSFIVESQDKQVAHFSVNVAGKQNVQNMLGAILVAKELGMSLEEISLAAKNITQAQAGITLKNGVHGIGVIDASYSSNPDGVMADLEYLNIFSQKKVVIMPCLIELGSKSSQIHKEIGKKIAEVCDLAIITTKDKFEEIKDSAIKNGMALDRIIFLENQKDIFHTVTTFCSEGDAILLEGRVLGELTKLLINKNV